MNTFSIKSTITTSFTTQGFSRIHISLEFTIYWAPDTNAIEVNKVNIF